MSWRRAPPAIATPKPAYSGLQCQGTLKPEEEGTLDIHTNWSFYTHVKRTNIVLDEKVMAAARRLTGLATQKDVVNHALRELVRRLEIAKLQELEGAIDWDGDLSEMRAGRELCEL
jgi:Arc/MetJ family transcription regulator